MAIAPDDVSYSTVATGYGQPIVADDGRTMLRNHVSWGAILVGVAVALVTQLLLNILGVGIGLSALDATNAGNNPDASNAGMSAGIWYVVSGILASFFGGAAAGRLCGTSQTNTARWHGFAAWATTTLMIVVLLTSAVGSIVGGTFNALGSVASGAGQAAASAVAGVAGSADGNQLADQVKSLVNPNEQQTMQNDVTTYVQASVSGDTQAADAARERAVNDVAKAANISPDEARKRIDDVANKAKATIADARDKASRAAEATRKAVSQGALYGVLALFLGGLAAWLGGGVGRPHRENALIATAPIR